MRQAVTDKKCTTKVVSVPEAVFKDLVETLKTLHASSHEALSGQWDRSDEGFESMMFLLEERFADLGIEIPDYSHSQEAVCP